MALYPCQPFTSGQTQSSCVLALGSEMGDNCTSCCWRCTQQKAKSRTSRRPSEAQSRSTSALSRHPRSSIRLQSLLSYALFTVFLFISIVNASPLSHSQLHRRLDRRQAIPDKFGNTGNEPAAVASQPAPQPFTATSSSAPTSFSTSLLLPTSTSTSTPTNQLQPEPTSTFDPNANGNAPPPADPEESGPNPTPNGPAERLTLTSPQLSMSPGAIAGIAGGGAVAVALLLLLGCWAYRRRYRRLSVTEIPIRRSKLGSRLGMRIFGDGFRSASRAQSRSSSRSSSRQGFTENEKGIETGAVDKGNISKPKAAWLENGLLSVPKPGYLKEEKAQYDEPWVAKETISGPRPSRPQSAEPLGRLSGMGLGMGYLK